MTTDGQAYVIFRAAPRVRVEIAETDEARARGLMFRDSLAEDEGMLFVFDEPERYGFWMKNVRVALDLLWLDRRGRIVWIVEAAPPCAGERCPTYRSAVNASFVLEVAAGFVHRHGIAVGDPVTIIR
jgi:uncharacterized membrane protein (UPF0127 family)